MQFTNLVCRYCVSTGTSRPLLCAVGLALTNVFVFPSQGGFLIPNASFEEPDQEPGMFSVNELVPHWEGSGGVWDISTKPFGLWNSTAPDGNQVLYVGIYPSFEPSYFKQRTGANASAGVSYVLSGMVGHPIGYGPSRGATYTVAILAGNDIVASVTSAGPEGSFAPFMVSWTATESSQGARLDVGLYSNGGQAAFDQISFAAVPEPRSAIITGIAGLLILTVRRLQWRS